MANGCAKTEKCIQLVLFDVLLGDTQGEGMVQKIYTFGTQRRKLQDLVELAEARDAVVVDVRYRAGSRVPDWNKGKMGDALGERYRHVRELGNKNYKSDGPIELADPEAGVEVVRGIMGAGKSVILLCYEEQPRDCHRTVAASLLAVALGYPVEHLLRPGL